MIIVNLNSSDVIIMIPERNKYARAYENTPSGRAAIVADCPPEIIAEVMAMWGDTPTVPDEPPAPILPPTPAQQIATLKQQIADTDYKIIKCSECRLVGNLIMPYDVAALHQERQVLRDEINRLETATT